MKNGVGVPQTIVLFGGTSDIGLATLKRLVKPGVSQIVLVSRDTFAAERAVTTAAFATGDTEIVHIGFDASDASSMPSVVDAVVAAVGDVDIVIIAQGLLGEGHDYYEDPAGVIDVANVNFTGTMALLYAVASRMRSQGYGKIVLLSSVAGERVRKGNPAYGATKAGIDGFALALDHELVDAGVSVLVVRPGFVSTKMTAGMDKAPFSTTADAVADATVKAIASDRKIVWIPGILRWVFAVLRVLPLPIWRRITG